MQNDKEKDDDIPVGQKLNKRSKSRTDANCCEELKSTKKVRMSSKTLDTFPNTDNTNRLTIRKKQTANDNLRLNASDTKQQI